MTARLHSLSRLFGELLHGTGRWLDQQARRHSDHDMRFTCYPRKTMPSMIQIRNVPDELHRELKVRSAQSGMTLSDYLLRELRGLAVRPTMQEWLTSSRDWKPLESAVSPAEAITTERSRALR
jgi:hypothetical protein